MGHVSLPGWSTRIRYMLGRLAFQSACAAAAPNVSRLGLTYSPSLFCICDAGHLGLLGVGVLHVADGAAQLL